MIRQNNNKNLLSLLLKSNCRNMMMRGTKRKIPLEKIEKKESRHVAFTKRSKGLYSKASDLCLLSGGQIAILATPVSSNSNVSFYSFGHSSVASVVSAFLANQRPREDDDQNLGFWWNDEGLARSENPEELREAMNFMSKMLQHLKDLEKREDVEKKRVLHAPHQNQTLDFQSSSTSSNFDKNSEDQILAISDNKKNSNSGLTANLDGIDANQELSLDQIFDIVESQGPPGNNEEVNLDDISDFEAYVYGGSTKDEDDLHAKRQSSSTSVNFDKNSEEEISDKNNNSGITVNLDGIGPNQEEPEGMFGDQDLDLDLLLKILDEDKCDSQRDIDENNGQLSDVFNELPSITAL